MALDQRVSTGVRNLDSLIEGGIPDGFSVMVAGNSGTGKTTLSSQFIYKGLTSQPIESGIFISFNESKTQFYSNSARLKMNFEKYEKQQKFIFLDFVSIKNDGIQDAFEEILAAIRTINAKRVVIDSFTALSLSFKDRAEARIALHVFLGKIMRTEGITSLIITETPYGKNDLGNGIEESVVDGILKLEHGPDNAAPIMLKVIKMRGTAINREKHVCNIDSNGLTLYPKQQILMKFPISNKRIHSGIVNFDDEIDGGGIIEGTVSAIVGASGSGKSTFALQFIAEGVRKYDETGIFCSLENTFEEIRRMGKGFDYNLEDLELSLEKNVNCNEIIKEKKQKVQEKGENLSIITYNHNEYHPDAFIASLEDEIKIKKPQRLVIDGLSVYEQKYKDEMYNTIERISSMTRKYNVTTMITLLGAQGTEFKATNLNLSPIFHNIVLLRFVELYGQMRRVLMILKISMSHQNSSIQEFQISKDKGLEIIGPIGNDYTGIFSGIARK